MTVEDFLNRYAKDLKNGWIIAALSDRYLVDFATSDETVKTVIANAGKVLDIRLFDKNKEHRLFRTGIGEKEFYQRSIDDQGVYADQREYYDEEQFLDIDETKECEGSYVRTTGGGKYKLPLNNTKNAKIRIRYYVGKYESTGQARIMDWRAVELMEGK